MTDTTLPVQTPDGMVFMLHAAGILPRLAAFWLDSFFQGCIWLVATIVCAAAGITGGWLQFLLLFGIQWVYAALAEIIGRGASPGKRILGIRAVMIDGRPLDAGAAILRNLLRFADFYGLLGFLLPLETKGFRRLGDLVAGTVVVTDPGRDVPRAPEMPVLPEEVLSPDFHRDGRGYRAATEFSRRTGELGPDLSAELARDGLAAFFRDPDALQGGHESGGGGGDPSRNMARVTAWFIRRRAP